MELDWEISCPKENAAEVTYFDRVRRYRPGTFFKMVAIARISDGRLKGFTLLRTVQCRALVDPNTVALETKPRYLSPWSSAQVN